LRAREWFTERVRGGDDDDAAALEREIDVIDALRVRDLDLPARLVPRALSVFERHVAGLVRGDAVAARRHFLEFESSVGFARDRSILARGHGHAAGDHGLCGDEANLGFPNRAAAD